MITNDRPTLKTDSLEKSGESISENEERIPISPKMIAAGAAVYEAMNWDGKLSDTVCASDAAVAELVSRVYLEMARTSSGSPLAGE